MKRRVMEYYNNTCRNLRFCHMAAHTHGSSRGSFSGSSFESFRTPKSNHQFNALAKSKSAGIIPYTVHNGQLLFLLQKIIDPVKKKDEGWNDFGGKKNYPDESTFDNAAREFSEETSCVFYLHETKNKDLFNDVASCDAHCVSEDVIANIKETIPQCQKYFANRIKGKKPIYISSKETYVSFFVYVDWIDEKHIPHAEDIHVHYEYRYIRKCKWFSYHELLNTENSEFHRRLQITKIKKRLFEHNKRGSFNANIQCPLSIPA